MTALIALKMADGVRVVVEDSISQITPYVLSEQQDWFEDEVRFLRQVLQPGQQVIDIGANHGVYALSMARTVGASGRVWAFEPATATADRLASGIEANGFAHVVLDRRALSDRCGRAELTLNPDSELNALVDIDASALEGSPRQSVDLTTLDACMDEHGWSGIDFVKIDAEGAEGAILAGGRRFLAEQTPLVEFEIKAGREVNLDLVRAFAERGYAAYRLVPGLGLLAPFDPSRPVDDYLLNLFACKPDRAERLAAAGHLVTAEALARAGSQEEAPARDDGRSGDDPHGWRSALSTLPYGRAMDRTWEETVQKGHSADVLEALRLHAKSQDRGQAPAERHHALRRSHDLLRDICEREPTFLRRASLARVAAEFGERKRAAEAVARLCHEMMASSRVDPTEPFLVPAARFERIPVINTIGNWMLAAALEHLERLATFSTYFAGPDALQRLDQIATLGYASDEMERRRRLLRARLGLQAATSPAAR